MPQTFISLRDRNETFQNGKRFRDKNFHWVIGEGLRWVKWLGKVLFFMQLFLQCILYCVAKVKERYFTMFHNRLSLSFIRSQWDGYHELLWNWKFEVDCLLAVVLQHWNSWALSIKRDFMVVWILIMVQNNSNQKYNKRKDLSKRSWYTRQQKSCDIFSSYNFNEHLDRFCEEMVLIKCLVLSSQ